MEDVHEKLLAFGLFNLIAFEISRCLSISEKNNTKIYNETIHQFKKYVYILFNI